MVRAVAIGFLALAAGQALALPTLENAQQMGEWEEAAVEAQKAAAASVADTISATQGIRMMGTEESSQQLAVQEAVLDSIMKEVQTIFKNTLTVPGWDNMDSAAETVKQIVDRVRERLAAGFTETEAGRTTMSTASALRGVTSDFLKEIMVQEAVIETLWAVLRDSQARPWITNEQQAMQTAAQHAVQGFLLRMHDRLRATGFTEEEIVKMMPRPKACTLDGPAGEFDTCPERNLGKRGGYGGYGGYGYGGYGHGGYGYRSYGYSYPFYGYSSYGYGYPYYGGYSYGYPYHARSYGYGYPYGYGYRGFYRRLGEVATPESSIPQSIPPIPVDEQMGFPAPGVPGFGLNGMGMGLGGMGAMGPPVGPLGMDNAAPRSLYASFARGFYPSYSYGYSYPSYIYGYSYPSYSYGYSYPSYSYGYSYPSYYSYSYPSYSLGYSYPSYYSYGYPFRSFGFFRRLEVPDLSVPSTTVPMDNITPNTTSTGRTGGFSQNSFRRVGESRTPMTTGSFYTGQNSPLNIETPFEPQQAVNENVSATWETTYN
uniref:Gametocyte protein n=1 Tax=Eimeria nieschulzi TaxID=44416 RepID=A0A0B5J8I8_9EIME|nr:gametocyte protein [Eimeria nieschulzi]